MALIDDVRAFVPGCEQEETDRALLLACLERDPEVGRRTSLAHLTTSAWTVDATGTQTLLCYHNIYDSWSWVGGHADGELDLAVVAARELAEETGVANASLFTDGLPAGAIFSIEALPVAGHVKRGAYVSSHVHLNVTYLLVVDPAEATASKPDENSGVRWVPIDDLLTLSDEPWMCERVYKKLIARTKALLGGVIS
ncbi:NUDIX hydrolase [Paratractidigestivibacter sp.]|uniref:NUDIX hydrolase n=1 Tax=Paratractidigestivibacter sp. TaxID=2847316 RepID=UPI002AC98D88|nr:NUDIX hydrolase [Paratractidigestivibacter sp.]